MPEPDPHELADQLEQETARLQDEIERLSGEVSSVREDWEHKRADSGVPGAPQADRPKEEENRQQEASGSSDAEQGAGED